MAYVAAICLMLGASGYMLFNDPMQGVNLLSGRDNAAKKLIKRGAPTKGRLPASQKEREEVVRRAEEQNKNYKASRVNKIRRAPTRMPASITDTDSFRNSRKMKERPFRDNEDPYQNEAYEDDYAYDDGSTPAAQDRVRKRLDKRTIDSEDQYYDESQRDEYAEVETAEGVWGESDMDRRSPANEDSYEENYNDVPQDTLQDDYREEMQEQSIPQEEYQDDIREESYNDGAYDDAPPQESYDDGASYQEEAYSEEPAYEDGY